MQRLLQQPETPKIKLIPNEFSLLRKYLHNMGRAADASGNAIHRGCGLVGEMAADARYLATLIEASPAVPICLGVRIMRIPQPLKQNQKMPPTKLFRKKQTTWTTILMNSLTLRRARNLLIPA